MREHPFAPYVRILGRDKNNSCPLTIDEAQAAMVMILEDKALPPLIVLIIPPPVLTFLWQ